MNAALSLNNHPETTPAQQAKRLEAFEIALRDERIAELEQDLSFATSEWKLSLERGAESFNREQTLRDELAHAALTKLQLQDGDVLQAPDGSYELLSHLAQAVRGMGLKNVLFICGDIKHLDEQNRRAIAEPFLEKLEAEVERLVVQDNASARVLSKTQQQLKEAKAEIKRLNALEPDRLSKLVKRLQKEKAEALAGAKEMRTRNHQLATQNVQLDKALDKAIADINSGQELKPERIFEPTRLGRWELFTSARNGWYQVLDVENEVSQTVRVEGGELVTPKVRPVPKAIAAEVMAFHQEHFGGEA